MYLHGPGNGTSSRLYAASLGEPPGTGRIESVHGTQVANVPLESVFWMFGAHVGTVIFDAPDPVRAAALSVAVGSGGAFKHLETHKLFTQEQPGQLKSSCVSQCVDPAGQ